MQRNFPKHVVISEEIVDADCLQSLKRGLGIAETVLTLDAVHRLREACDQPCACGALDHGEPIVANALGMRMDGGLRQHCYLPRRRGAAPWAERIASAHMVCQIVIARHRVARSNPASWAATKKLDCFVAFLLAMTAERILTPPGGTSRKSPPVPRSTASTAQN